jgi:hypothetical protein
MMVLPLLLTMMLSSPFFLKLVEDIVEKIIYPDFLP